MIKGRVTKSTGSWYRIQTEDGTTLACRIAGKIKLDDSKLTNPVAVGDYVYVELENPEQGIIKKIEPRRNYIVRQSPRKRHQLHFLASNVDQVVLIVTVREPNLKLGFIDRYLLMCEPYNIPATIVVNKYDIYTDEDKEYLSEIERIYLPLGYQVITTSSVTGLGVDALRDILRDKITLISGQSGVGKSTLVNKIEPDLELLTGEISDFSGKGQHTTTFAEMFHLSIGGDIIDTPGIKTLAFSHLEVLDAAHNFREFFERSEDCKFANCTHRNEPKCAVKKALDLGEISPTRYNNYLNICEEIEDQNYWERHTDI
jgi:ribosome biogenesis GTPase / thiamine phosphate phosphatase